MLLGWHARRRAARPCLGCGSTEGLDWWVGRMAHPARRRRAVRPATSATCASGIGRIRIVETGRSRPSRGLARSSDTRRCPAKGLSRLRGEHRHGNGQRCADCAHDHRKSLRSTAEARRLDAVRAGDQDIHWTLLGERDGWVCHICSARAEGRRHGEAADGRDRGPPDSDRPWRRARVGECRPRIETATSRAAPGRRAARLVG